MAVNHEFGDKQNLLSAITVLLLILSVLLLLMSLIFLYLINLVTIYQFFDHMEIKND